MSYSDNDSLCGMQLFFEDHKTPKAETGGANGEWRDATVDVTRRIASVSVFINRYGEFYKMRLNDEMGMEMFYINVYDSTRGEWHTKEVPEGQVVVGLAVNTDSDNSYLKKIGFICAEE